MNALMPAVATGVPAVPGIVPIAASGKGDGFAHLLAAVMPAQERDAPGVEASVLAIVPATPLPAAGPAVPEQPSDTSMHAVAPSAPKRAAVAAKAMAQQGSAALGEALPLATKNAAPGVQPETPARTVAAAGLRWRGAAIVVPPAMPGLRRAKPPESPAGPPVAVMVDLKTTAAQRRAEGSMIPVSVHGPSQAGAPAAPNAATLAAPSPETPVEQGPRRAVMHIPAPGALAPLSHAAVREGQWVRAPANGDDSPLSGDSSSLSPGPGMAVADPAPPQVDAGLAAATLFVLAPAPVDPTYIRPAPTKAATGISTPSTNGAAAIAGAMPAGSGLPTMVLASIGLQPEPVRAGDVSLASVVERPARDRQGVAVGADGGAPPPARPSTGRLAPPDSALPAAPEAEGSAVAVDAGTVAALPAPLLAGLEAERTADRLGDRGRREPIAAPDLAPLRSVSAAPEPLLPRGEQATPALREGSSTGTEPGTVTAFAVATAATEARAPLPAASSAAPPMAREAASPVSDTGGPAALTVASDRLGAVGIGVEGSAQDLRVRLTASVASAGTMAAEMPRLLADLAAQGVRVQSLDLAARLEPQPGGAAGGSEHRPPTGDAPPRQPPLAALPGREAASDGNARDDRHRTPASDRYA